MSFGKALIYAGIATATAGSNLLLWQTNPHELDSDPLVFERRFGMVMSSTIALNAMTWGILPQALRDRVAYITSALNFVGGINILATGANLLGHVQESKAAEQFAIDYQAAREPTL